MKSFLLPFFLQLWNEKIIDLNKRIDLKNARLYYFAFVWPENETQSGRTQQSRFKGFIITSAGGRIPFAVEQSSYKTGGKMLTVAKTFPLFLTNVSFLFPRDRGRGKQGHFIPRLQLIFMMLSIKILTLVIY